MATQGTKEEAEFLKNKAELDKKNEVCTYERSYYIFSDLYSEVLYET